MIRISPFIVVPCLVIASSSGLAQTKETPQARAAYARVVAVRDSMERAHGHFVAVNGIRMHYLEWGDAPSRIPPRMSRLDARAGD